MKIKLIAALALLSFNISALPYAALDINSDKEKLGGSVFLTLYDSKDLVVFLNPHVSAYSNEQVDQHGQTIRNDNDYKVYLESSLRQNFSLLFDIGGGFRFKSKENIYGASIFWSINDYPPTLNEDELSSRRLHGLTIATEAFIKDNFIIRINGYLYSPFKNESPLFSKDKKMLSVRYDFEKNQTSIGKRFQNEKIAFKKPDGIEAEIMFNPPSSFKKLKLGVQVFYFQLKNDSYKKYGGSFKAIHTFNKTFQLGAQVESNNINKIRVGLLLNIHTLKFGNKLNNKTKLDEHFYRFVKMSGNGLVKIIHGNPLEPAKLRDKSGAEIPDQIISDLVIGAPLYSNNIITNVDIVNPSKKLEEIIFKSALYNRGIFFAVLDDNGEYKIKKLGPFEFEIMSKLSSIAQQNIVIAKT